MPKSMLRDNWSKTHFCISSIYILIIRLMLICVARKEIKICDWQQLWQANTETGKQMPLINTPMAGLGIWFSNFFVQNKPYSSQNNKITKVAFLPTGNRQYRPILKGGKKAICTCGRKTSFSHFCVWHKSYHFLFMQSLVIIWKYRIWLSLLPVLMECFIKYDLTCV